MKKFLLSVILAFGFIVSEAQKTDTSARITNTRITNSNATKITLTRTQNDWINRNYKFIGKLSRDSASRIVRSNFTSLDESTLDFMISQASRLLKADSDKNLQLLQQMLNDLKGQKQALQNKITEKEKELNSTTDAIKQEKIRQEIVQLQRQMALLNERIRSTEESIRREG